MSSQVNGMAGKGAADQPNVDEDTARKVRKRIWQVVIQFVLLAVMLFGCSGRLDWVWGWALLGVGLAILAVNARVMPRELIAERGQPGENVKRWDRVLSALSGLPSLAAPIVCGLDERFSWSLQFPLGWHLFGIALMALGQGLFTWAMVSNKFFSTLVRIQMDRDHTVSSGGPYKYVRHPGYVGYILSGFATPLALGSLWGLIPAGLTMVLLSFRTALEDKTLLEELGGYREYARRVRYRLVPGIW